MTLKNILKVILSVILFAAAGAGVAYFVFDGLGLGNTGEVPSLAGKTLTEAAEALNKRKLHLNVTGSEFHDTVPEGHVIRQQPAPGERLGRGAEVGVTVSNGKTDEDHGGFSLPLPSFEDQLLEDAKLTLTNLNIKAGRISWVHSETIGKGKIIAQRPLPGSMSRGEINFLVSLGPYEEEYKCPSFTEMSPEDARAVAKVLGIELIEKAEGNKIIAQKPSAGEIIKKGSTVEITLGRSRFWF